MLFFFVVHSCFYINIQIQLHIETLLEFQVFFQFTSFFYLFWNWNHCFVSLLVYLLISNAFFIKTKVMKIWKITKKLLPKKCSSIVATNNNWIRRKTNSKNFIVKLVSSAMNTWIVNTSKGTKKMETKKSI